MLDVPILSQLSVKTFHFRIISLCYLITGYVQMSDAVLRVGLHVLVAYFLDHSENLTLIRGAGSFSLRCVYLTGEKSDFSEPALLVKLKTV